MLLLRLIKRNRLLVLMLLLVGLTGCSALTVYPIKDTDIRVTDDEVIMSKWYFENVLKVKLEEGR